MLGGLFDVGWAREFELFEHFQGSGWGAFFEREVLQCVSGEDPRWSNIGAYLNIEWNSIAR